MRIVVGYTHLPAEVEDALGRYAAGCDIDRRDCSSSVEAYHELLASAWQRGDDFIVCEHDIVIDERTLPEFEACEEPWCGFGYELAVGYRVALGLTRFRGELVRAVPDLFDLVQLETSSGVPPKAWYRLDVRLDQVLRERGYTPHLHMPPVAHLNGRQRLESPVPVYAAGKEH